MMINYMHIATSDFSGETYSQQILHNEKSLYPGTKRCPYNLVTLLGSFNF